MRRWDVTVVGAGPAGSFAAAECARVGLKTLLIDRTRFPREKVCGDCLNPSVFPLLEEMGVADEIFRLPHSRTRKLEILAANGALVDMEIPRSVREIVIKRSKLDELLANRAVELGAEFQDMRSVHGLEGESLRLDREIVRTRVVIAADGRNSTIARSLRQMPRPRRDRVAVQAHLDLPEVLRGKISMRLHRHGYSGAADAGNGQANVCLVSLPGKLADLRCDVGRIYGLNTSAVWRTTTPLSRRPVAPAVSNVLFAGDSARVVEPFTGEGIYYAMQSGREAGKAAALACETGDLPRARAAYFKAHRSIYRDRLWVNRIARFAVLQPQLASVLLAVPFLGRVIVSQLSAKVLAA